jgi:toxin YoeB
MKVSFEDGIFEQYRLWEDVDKKIKKKLDKLLKECQRTPYAGTGKPEPLKHKLSGWWSRHITEEHRLVYKVEDDVLYIKSCKGHYGD